MRSRPRTTLTIISVNITTGAGRGGCGGGAGGGGGAGRGLHFQYGAYPGCEGVQPGVDPRDLCSTAVAVAHNPNLSESSLLLHKERPPRVSLATVLARPAGAQRDVVVAEGDQVTVIPQRS